MYCKHILVKNLNTVTYTVVFKSQCKSEGKNNYANVILSWCESEWLFDSILFLNFALNYRIHVIKEAFATIKSTVSDFKDNSSQYNDY